jgi:hypothetical protein
MLISSETTLCTSHIMHTCLHNLLTCSWRPRIPSKYNTAISVCSVQRNIWGMYPVLWTCAHQIPCLVTLYIPPRRSVQPQARCQVICNSWSAHHKFKLYQFRRMPSSGMLRCDALVRTDVSEERSASIISVTRTGEHGISCKIWGFHGGDYEEWCLLGCYAVWQHAACVGC